MVPEIWGATEISFSHFRPVFVITTQKMKILKKWKKKKKKKKKNPKTNKKKKKKKKTRKQTNKKEAWRYHSLLNENTY